MAKNSDPLGMKAWAPLPCKESRAAQALAEGKGNIKQWKKEALDSGMTS